jgi:hypothetical protein
MEARDVDHEPLDQQRSDCLALWARMLDQTDEHMIERLGGDSDE